MSRELILSYRAFRSKHQKLGVLLLIVNVTAIFSCALFAYVEGKNCEDGGAHKIVLESVTVLLILDLDERVYASVAAYYGYDGEGKSVLKETQISTAEKEREQDLEEVSRKSQMSRRSQLSSKDEMTAIPDPELKTDTV